ncbi:larval cuticle protein 65Ag1-like [Sabethes cyaneus]|uniref:larval cuticle protein 65Ag1-like n=1 Tax=Sabethes cyaneus TaxID=53552 RepID=UPI00237E4F2C|nr:larval cuticle protein 65Ag1-like [Sabethes cyaneus]
MKVLIVFAFVAVAAVFADTKVLKYENVIDGETYKYAYETDDGTSQVQQGDQKGEDLLVQGNFKFVSDDGQEYKVTYVADGNGGFRAEGAHVPKEYVEKLSSL